MKRNVFIVFLGVLFFLNCSDKEKKKQDLIDISKVSLRDIKGSSLSFLGDDPLLPKGCLLVDSLFITFEPSLKKGFIGIYDINNSKIVRRFGNIGQGPNDFLNVRFFPNLRSESSKSFSIGSINHLYSFNVDSLLEGHDTSKDYILSDIPEDLRGYNYILKNTEDVIIANVTGEHQLSFYDKKNKSIVFKDYFDKEDRLDNISQFSYANVIYDAYYTSDNKNVIAIAYKNLKKIDLISIPTGKLLKSIEFPDFDKNLNKINKIDNSNIEIKEGVLYYTFVYPTEEKFYALCWDSTKDKIKRGEAVPTIHVFDWKGNLLEILQPDIPISFFCVDKFSDKLYAVGQDKESLDLQIYKFNIHAK